MPGPPCVSTAICANTCSDPTMVMIIVSSSVGEISGSVIAWNCVQRFAPSTRAAS